MNRYADRCIRQQLPQSTCDACIQVCPAGAIEWNNEIQIDAAACQDCGLCQSACRQGVFSHETYSLQYPTLKSGQTGFSCRNVELLDSVHRLPCLGMLDETELVSSILTHQLATLELHFGDCETCPWQQGQGMAQQAIQQAESLFTRMGVKTVIVQLHATKALKPTIQRRDFFYMGLKWLENKSKKQLAQKVDQVVEQLAEDSPTAKPVKRQKKIPMRRAKLLTMIEERGISLMAEDLPALSRAKQIAQACNHCQLCSEICPTGALRYQVTEQTGSIWFSHYLCTDCHACIDLCPQQAFAEADKMGTLLSQRALQTCSDCGQVFTPQHPEQVRCVPCQNRNDLLQSIWASTPH